MHGRFSNRYGRIVAVGIVAVGLSTGVVIVAHRTSGVVTLTATSPSSTAPTQYVATQIAPTVTTVPAGTPSAGTVPGLPDASPSATPPCPPTPSALAPSALTLTIGADSHFNQPCYFAAAGRVLSVTFVNEAVNPATKLVPPISFSVLPETTAGTHIVGGITERPLPSPASSVFESPTALDSVPVQFPLGPLAAGRYELTQNPPTSGAPILTVQ